MRLLIKKGLSGFRTVNISFRGDIVALLFGIQVESEGKSNVHLIAFSKFRYSACKS